MSEQIQAADRDYRSSQAISINDLWGDEPNAQHGEREQNDGNAESIAQEPISHGLHLLLVGWVR